MKIIVCMKAVPSTNEVRLNPETNTIIRDGQAVVNPFDAHALEEALRIREACGGEVHVLSMGIPDTERLLRDAVSRGADAAWLLSDRAFAGADTLATAYTLSLGVGQIGDFDLILCGKMAVDGDTAQIGPELAEFLDIPHVTDVKSVERADGQSLTCVKADDYGECTVEIKLPALLTVVKNINLPRLPSIPGVRRGMEADCRVLTARALSADPGRCGLDGSPTQVVRTFTPDRGKSSAEISGGAMRQAEALAGIIGEVLQ